MHRTIQKKWMIFLVVMGVISLYGTGVSASSGNPPVPEFTLSAVNGYAPLTITMTDASTGNPDSWSWTIDGSLHKTGKGPFTISLNNPGTYMIGLVVENPYGSSSKEIPVYVYSPVVPVGTCVVMASPDKITLGWGDPVTFTGTATGCPGSVKVPLTVRVRGPNLPANGLDLTRDLDYITSPPDTNEAFPFTWYTGTMRLNNNVNKGVYTVTFIDGTGAEYSPVKLDFSKQPSCSLKATADQPQYFWGQQIRVTGTAIDCPGGIKVKLGSVPNGPEIPGVVHYPIGSTIPEGIDLATGQPGSDSSFSFTLDTSSLQQQYALKDGLYNVDVLDMTDEMRYVKIPVHMGVLGSPTCSVSINNPGAYENTWGDRITFTGLAEKCPGMEFILVPGSTLIKTIPPTGIPLGAKSPASDSTYSWTWWNSAETQQKYSLADGVYEVYAKTPDGQYSGVSVKMTTSGTGNPSPADCTHFAYAYAIPESGIGEPTGLTGIKVQVFGSNTIDTYQPADLVSTATTRSNGQAPLYISKTNLGKWQYFISTFADPLPAGYTFEQVSGNQNSIDTAFHFMKKVITFKSQEVCSSSTDFLFVPAAGSPGTTAIPILQAVDPGSGKQTPSFFNFILSIPQTVMSIIHMSPASDTPESESVSVADVRQESSAKTQDESMHVVVLPGSDDQRTEPLQDSGNNVPIITRTLQEPPFNYTQVYMTESPEGSNVTPSTEPRIRATETYIGNEPQLAPVKLPCPSGYVTCNGQCVDPMTDTNDCGSCNTVCPSGFVCFSGMCNSPCTSEQTRCNGICVNLLTTANDCGACGRPCVNGYCSNGTCISFTCTNNGQTICNGVCVNLLTDPANCGTCGNVCTNGGTCGNGQCVLPMVKIQPTGGGNIGITRSHI